MIDRFTLKLAALRRIAAAKPSAYAVTLVYLLLTYVTQIINGNLNGRISAWYQYFYFTFYTRFATNSAEMVRAFRDAWASSGFAVDRPVYEKTIWISVGFIIALALLMQCVRVGYESYALKVSRGEQGSYRDIGNGFPLATKIIFLYIVQGIIVFLLSCLFIIPGLIALYKYRLSYYILLDHPDWGAMRCLMESRRLMRGKKAALFLLDLSFLGWYILCSITMGLLLIWKQPHFSVTYALFYGECAGRSSWDFEDVPPDPSVLP